MADSLATQLAQANRILANEGITDGFGHVSVRHPERDTMLISCSRSPVSVTEADVLEVTMDGDVLDDDRSTYLENVIHRAIYRARPDVGAVVHHHAPAILPFAITDVEYRPVCHKGMPFHDGVPKFDAYDPERGWLVVTEAEAERLAANLGDHRAQLLEGHGANTVGRDLREAICVTYDFVLNAEHLLAGLQIGDVTFDPQDEEMARRTVEEAELADVAIDRLWEYLCSRLPADV